MAAVHDVLRYLLARVPASTQEDHDRVAGLIDADESGVQPVPAAKKES
jgi:hypothetical protein